MKQSELFDISKFWNPRDKALSKKLSQRFVVPPFSVLDARQGYWTERKRLWLQLGMQQETGRGYMPEDGENFDADFDNKWGLNVEFDVKTQKALGCIFAKGTIDRNTGGVTCTSIFDPVLAEIICRWFCPDSGTILDPFAGEATKGIVSEYLGYNYTGIELREEQVLANRKQAERIGIYPNWIHGDSTKLATLVPSGSKYDLVFTSPPYYNLEIYSANSAQDGSAFTSYQQFMGWYKYIFGQAVDRLKEDRFLVVKVGEIRDEKRGVYRNFVGDNVNTFRELGLEFYNEAILVTPVGSMAPRASRQFIPTRKLTKGHQNVLVFYKGDTKNIKNEFPAEI